MTTRLYTHQDCFGHVNGPMHPERPERLAAVGRALAAPAFAALDRREAPRASEDLLRLAHPPDYVDAILGAAPASGLVRLDADTGMSAGSGEAALRAAGAACAAVDAVLAGEADNAFCAVRPPGHHAERSTAMGFCLFNNVAVAAEHARRRHGLERVAVLDFDVHHGNGTQHMFEEDRNLFFGSSHQWPLYPGTGAAGERGVGNIFNTPLAPRTGGEAFRAAWAEIILPALRAFRPELIILSAGFDAHAADPLAQLELVEADFAWATRAILEVAEACCEGRLVSSLEGGYDLGALGRSAAAHVGELMAAAPAQP